MKWFILILLLVLSGCTQQCSDFTLEECPDQCQICPPCEVCSSVSCNTKEHCQSIGFEKGWWESVQP